MNDSRAPIPALENPPRLLGLDGPQRELLERAQLGFRHGLDERRAFKKLDARLSAPLAIGWRWPLGLSLAAATVWLLALGLPSWRAPQLGAIGPESEARATRVGLRAAPEVGQRFAEGATELNDGSVVSLERATTVSLLEQTAQRTRLGLKLGAATFQVAPQKPGRSFAVQVGPYEFVALGTVFSINAGQDAVELIVAEGRVAVSKGTVTLTTLGPGQAWSGATAEPRRESTEVLRAVEPARPADSAAVSAEVPPDLPATANCKELSRSGDKALASECWAKQAQGSGLSAEVAVYQLGLLKRDGGDVPGAIATMRGYRARFPQGSLQGEVALTLVELYASSGQARDALDESERLLATGYGRERAEQLHWLRGNLYREALRDYVRAQAEYEQINPSAKQGAEALYFTALCLEQRGQREAARQAYEQYTRHPRATRKAAVLQKLEQLGR